MVDMKKAGPKGTAKVPVASKAPAAADKVKPAAVVAAAPAVAPKAPAAGSKATPAPVKLAPAPVTSPASVVALKANLTEVAKPSPSLEAAPATKAVPVPVQLELPKDVIVLTAFAPKAPALRQAVNDAVTTSAKGALAVNEKILDALQVQGHAALDLWLNAVSTPDLPEVLRLQSSGARQAYETASAQWKDIAETTAHWMKRTVEPFSAALADRQR